MTLGWEEYNLMARRFSIPFTWQGRVNDYLDYVKTNIQHIDSVYFSLPYSLGIDSHFTANPADNGYPEEQLEFRDAKIYQFAERSLGVVKRLATINTVSYFMSSEEYVSRIKNNVIPFLKEHKIEGVILSHLFIGRIIKEAIPEIDIQTSSNAFQFMIPQMEIWRRELGTEIFNAPREAGRTPGMLQQFKSAGYKMKVFANDACLYGCPHQILHAATTGFQHKDHLRGINVQCTLWDSANIFRGNWLVPRWLPLVDEYVYVYKIVGRGYLLSHIKKIVDAYITLDDSYSIMELTGYSGTFNELQYKNICIPTAAIPDKLLTCQSLECDTCGVCKQLAEEYLS
jgi:hypothetical protein